MHTNVRQIQKNTERKELHGKAMPTSIIKFVIGFFVFFYNRAIKP